MNIAELKIDEAKCVHCGKCVKDCIVHCLELNEESKIPQFVKGKSVTVSSVSIVLQFVRQVL